MGACGCCMDRRQNQNILGKDQIDIQKRRAIMHELSGVQRNSSSILTPNEIDCNQERPIESFLSEEKKEENFQARIQSTFVYQPEIFTHVNDQTLDRSTAGSQKKDCTYFEELADIFRKHNQTQDFILKGINHNEHEMKDINQNFERFGNKLKHSNQRYENKQYELKDNNQNQLNVQEEILEESWDN